MFKRRVPLTPLQVLREIFWPSMGFARAFSYIKLRIARLSDTAHKIAFGLALGVGISFTPLVGTHLIQVGILAYVLRANLIAALIGTLVGNPWTFPLMWWAAIQFGSYLFEMFGLPAAAALPDEVSLSVMWNLLWHEPLRIFLPWALGGYLLAGLTVPFTYIVFLNMVKGAQLARRKARTRQLHQVAKQITGQMR